MSRNPEPGEVYRTLATARDASRIAVTPAVR
jgi:hypothetical protein